MGKVSISQVFFAGISKIFILAESWLAGHYAIILWGLDTFLILPNFLGP